MIKLEKTEVYGWEAAIRGMRNPLNSWNNSDTDFSLSGIQAIGGLLVPTLGENDHALMMKLAKAGSDHRKFMRQILVSVDITAPRYWWEQFATYRVGVVQNSTSTMHTIHKKEFTLDDFSNERMLVSPTGKMPAEGGAWCLDPVTVLNDLIITLNACRYNYLMTGDKRYWDSMIQLLPQSYNQLRTVTLNYEVLSNMYHARRNHKLNEWVEFCNWIAGLPYPEIIVGGK